LKGFLMLSETTKNPRPEGKSHRERSERSETTACFALGFEGIFDVAFR
jgi:hypothetical protein